MAPAPVYTGFRLSFRVRKGGGSRPTVSQRMRAGASPFRCCAGKHRFPGADGPPCRGCYAISRPPEDAGRMPDSAYAERVKAASAHTLLRIRQAEAGSAASGGYRPFMWPLAGRSGPGMVFRVPFIPGPASMSTPGSPSGSADPDRVPARFRKAFVSERPFGATRRLPSALCLTVRC